MVELPRITRNTTLSEQVANELRHRISSGEWPIGTKIPPEPELVKALGVSRSTLREAVRSLAQVRMLETRPGDGTYVRADNPLQYPLLDRIAHSDVRDVLEVRAMLEERTARLAAQRCTPADTRVLRLLLANIETLAAQTNSVDVLLPAGLAVYRKLGEITGNRLLAELYQHLTEPTHDELGPSLTAEFMARWQILMTELVDAITANEPDRAEQAIRDLLTEILREMA
ncbi:FadR/GntR family transcriptional regulator [Nocardia mangyaensis]|uniref:FadR/GntR family transcriptional regulator n=1 Tax=Nocardia mangyaensis TaxID=2213200 RepID=UPI002675EC0E|nr:GntR family transcriptional regulator [Nocardia mangyaensis]MDO3651268.1 GntR family transcriptional regulator [Nocardia mangyaensis]